MKKLFMAVVALLYGFIGASMVFAAADTWTQKADFGGTARLSAVVFSIGSKGYIGTGNDGSSANHYCTKDFWEYDPVENTWTQKADFGGGMRTAAVGFSIGSKGYIGTGISNGSHMKDFWEYDPGTNKWTQKADFGGVGRYLAVGFSIDNKGYIGTGYDGSSRKNDFWEYDPGTNKWTQKADVGGPARIDAVGFSIGSKGYIGTGSDNTAWQKDFWEYDPSTNKWTQKADVGTIKRTKATGLSIGNLGYVGLGWVPDSYGVNGYGKDFWEYNPSKNTWTKIADFGGTARSYAKGFSIMDKGYIGTGFAGFDGTEYSKNFWEYEPTAMSVTITFEGLTDWEIVGDYYNGGYGYDYYTGLPKSGPGPNYGVIFPRGFAAIDSDEGGTGNFGGEPSPSTAVWFQQGGGAWMNVTNGFTGSLSFYYSNPNNPSKIYIYDGLNKTGNLLATLNLPLTAYKGALDPTGNLSPLVYTEISFNGIAKSVDFGELAHSAYVDDITLGTLDSPVADTTPDQFIFNYVTGLNLNTVVTSNTITVAGINAAAPIAITGGKYSINGGSYTNTAGTVKNGDKVTVQVTSSAYYATTTEATLTIGGVSDTFSVTTKEESIISLNPVANRTILWPPNNKMVPIIIKANASDSSGEPVTLSVIVSCNEPAGLGRDWTKPVINQKKGIINLSLRATRLGNGTGRIYTITITATGVEGNSVTKSITITVPHDKRK